MSGEINRWYKNTSCDDESRDGAVRIGDEFPRHAIGVINFVALNLHTREIAGGDIGTD
jgi:hypothetical protein